MDMSLVEMFKSMSIAVKLNTIFMMALSIYSVYVIVEKFLTFRKGAAQTFSFVQSLGQKLKKHKIDDAIQAAKLHSASPVAKTIGSGLDAYKEGMTALKEEGPNDVGDFDLVDSVNRALERVKERETANLRKRLGGLATVASITPFVGLFGTVLGIISAFGKLSDGGGIDVIAFGKLSDGGGIDVIGPGIAEALISTAFGLLVAIPAAMFFNYYTGRVENVVVDINDTSSEFVDYVLKEGRV